MAKGKTSSNGAVAAATDFVPDAAAKIVKAHDTIVAAHAMLEDENAKMIADHEKAVVVLNDKIAALKVSMQRDIDEWKNRAIAAETKVQKVFGAVS